MNWAYKRNPGTFHYETLAIKIQSLADLDKAKPYLYAGYNKLLARLASSGSK